MFAVEPEESPTGIDGLVDRNMAAFERLFPHVHERLARIGQPHSSLVVSPDGSVDMKLGGMAFYDTDAVTFTERQLTDYFENPARRFLNEPDPAMVRGISGEFVRELRSMLDAKGVQIGSPQSTASYYTVVFGVGLGLHVSHLMENTGCRLLILIEPNIENIFHSLSVVDWDSLFESADSRGCKPIFIIENHVDAILLQARNAIRDRNPALIDGVYLYTHYHTSVLHRARESFSNDFMLLLVGLGYLEDEFKMTANAASNIARRRVRVLADPLSETRVPLLIVGSGPSVDGDLDKLEWLAGRALVMSVGTGLRVLLDCGIRPDFHVEVENFFENAESIKVVRDEFGLDGITLVGAISVHPSVRELFDETILFFRERSSATMLFGDGRGLIQPSGPTVANAALSAAVRLGFRQIYFFGLDMGSKVSGRYHSARSVYGVGQFKEQVEKIDIVVPGNLGGEASVDDVLFWSRYMLESFLRLHPKVDCFNCSDGARIVGATPMVARCISLDPLPFERRELVNAIITKLPVIDKSWQDRCWDKEEQVIAVREVTQRLRSIISRAGRETEPSLDWMDDIIETVRYEVGESPVVRSYLFGSFVLMLGCFAWYAGRMPTSDHEKLCRDIALDLFRSAIDYCERVIMLLADEVTAVLNRALDIVEIPPYEVRLIARVPGTFR